MDKFERAGIVHKFETDVLMARDMLEPIYSGEITRGHCVGTRECYGGVPGKRKTTLKDAQRIVRNVIAVLNRAVSKQLSPEDDSFPALTFPRGEVSKTRARFEGSLQVPQVPLARGCVVSIFRSPDRLQLLLLARSAFDLEFRLDVLRRKALAPATSTSDAKTVPESIDVSNDCFDLSPLRGVAFSAA
jgi:hypothetical protein